MQFRPSTRRSQMVRLTLCLAALVAATVISLRQPAPGQFEPLAAVGSWKWWGTPLEENIAFRPPVTRAPLNSVFFLPGQDQVGWAVGSNGTVLYTEDGGRSWRNQNSGTAENLTSITFATPQSGWAVGWRGIILHTEDGGRTWQTQTSGTTAYLSSVTFVTPHLGWAVGDDGTILHTRDGGKEWLAQSSSTTEYLMAVSFVTPESGWAVGYNGTILRTEDGGGTWLAHLVITEEVLLSVTFATTHLGWVVGTEGTILHTEDGGRTWLIQSSGTREHLVSVSFSTPQSGWAVGFGDTILRTEDGGRTWLTLSIGVRETLHAVVFPTAQSGWTVGASGRILHTEDGGRTWQTQSSEISPMECIAFPTPKSGWIVRQNGTVLHTEDGGRTWTPQSSGTIEHLRFITFTSPQSGWAVKQDGTVLHTEDLGRSWLAQSSEFEETADPEEDANPKEVRLDRFESLSDRIGHLDHSPISVAFITSQLGWALNWQGKLMHTDDGGKTWQFQNNREFMQSVTFATPQLGWAVKKYGAILHSDDGGRTWLAQTTEKDLHSVSFPTPKSGWVVGRNGTILDTEDGGRTWLAQTSGTREDLNSVAFATTQTGWAVGDNGTILHTENAGATWEAIHLYHRWPAPWYYATLALCVIGLSWASLTVRPSNVPFVEDVANSDNPVARLERDALGYRPMVTRLLRFIQNPSTAPPLVLAIQAPWGMGKSSAMRMLQSELQNKRAAVTVWFNAWHHQKEDQLLAYLLEAIQKQVAPSWFSAVGLGFRFNLLRVRMFAGPIRFLATLGALLSLVFHSGIAGSISARIAPWIAAEKSHPLSLLAVWSVGVGILLNQIRAFSSDPQKLLESSGKPVWKSLQDLFVFPTLQGKTDVRQEFEKNLREVTDALRPQRLVVFLDDLDRCRPEQVVQILEAINFLSSAAPCFIVVGADYGKVETLVGMQFEHLAVQEKENAGAEKPDAARTRLEYARSHMKKVVNIRLNLPRPGPEAWEKFLAQPAERSTDTAMHWQRGLLAAVLLLCIAAVVATGMGWVPTSTKTQPTDAATAIPGKAIVAENPQPTGPAAPKNDRKSETDVKPPSEPPQPTQVRSDTEDRNRIGTLWSNRLTIGTASLMALVFLVVVFRRPKEIEKAVDSREFAETLTQMTAQIARRNRTPREMRRFLNYLRLVAAPDDPADGRSQNGDEAGLVRLAAMGVKDSQEDLNVIELFRERCDMFGLDPQKFTPKDETEDESAKVANS